MGYIYNGEKFLDILYSQLYKSEEVQHTKEKNDNKEESIKRYMDRLEKALKRYDIKQVVLAGGVSANSYLREQMHNRLDNSGIDLIVPPIWCTTDNAAMIVRLGEHLWKMGITAPNTISCDPNWRIDKYKTF